MAEKSSPLDRFTQLVWGTNLFFLVACLATLTQFLTITFIPGSILGVVCAVFLSYRYRTFNMRNSLKYALVINFAVLYITVLVVSYFLWNTLLREKALNIAEYIVVLFFLLGLGSVGLLLRMAYATGTQQVSTERRMKDIMSGPSLFLSFCVAAILTDLTLIVFFILNEGKELAFLREKFLQRGIIPPLCLVLFYWECVLLLGKYYMGQRSFRSSVATDSLATNELVLLWQEYKKTQRTKTNVSQANLLQKFVDMAWQANESFYFFPRYINWAIPILGFIGTVLGISLAAGEIGNLVGSSSLNIGDSINAAMRPLGIAFDTTLIALSLSVFLAFVYTLLQRWEEQRFLFLEEYIAQTK